MFYSMACSLQMPYRGIKSNEVVYICYVFSACVGQCAKTVLHLIIQVILKCADVVVPVLFSEQGVFSTLSRLIL